MSSSKLTRRLQAFGAETVWQEFTPLAREMNAVNLGQGFPDWETPTFVKEALKRSVDEGANQYCRSAGHPPLVRKLAERYSKFLQRDVNWETEVTVGVGATETLFAITQSLINEGDEAILISPAFDIYSAQIQMAGGVCKYVPLRTVTSESDPSVSEWKLDMDELRSCFSDKTKIFLLNTPQNPTGKVFNRSELEQIAAILRDFPNVVAVCDEVYEHMIYDNKEFHRLATLPDMWERTITVSSSGKTFSCTGWKVGWAVGPSELISGVVLANQWVQFSVSTPAQQAIAYALEEADTTYQGHPNFYSWLLDSYARKKNILIEGLKNAGLNPIVPEGGFFIIADTSNIEIPEKYLQETTPAAPVMTRDWAFCRFLTSEIKVAAIPPSAFYEDKDKHLAANYARFAFCKEDESLLEASKNLLKLREFVKDESLLPKL